MAKKKSILKGVQEKEAAFNEKLVKPIEIGYDKDRAFTLTNAGSLTGAHLSEEMTDYIIQEAEKAGIDLQTAFGIAAAESTLGNPTDDKSAWNISSGIRRAFDNVYPGTAQHINTYGDVVNEQELFNFYYPLENQNPYTQQIAEADRQARKGKDFELALIDGMSYADKLAQKPVPTGSVAQQAFEYFKLNGEGYAPGYKEQTGQSYVQHVRKKGKEALQSPEIQRAIANYALKKIGRPKDYSFGTFDIEPAEWQKKAEGGPLNLKPWEGLSMRERAAYIRDAVSRGLNTVTDIRNDYNEFKGGGKKKTNNSSVLTFLNLLNESLKGNSRYNTTGWRKYLTDLAKMESSYRGDVTNSIGAKGYFLLMPSNRSASWSTPTQLFHEMYKLSDANMDYFRKNMTERDLKLAEQMGIDIYGLMAGAHLGGPKNALAALRGGHNSKDKNGTSVLSYMTRFSQTTPRQPISGDFKTVYFQPPIEETPEVEAPNPYVGYKLISLEDIDNLPLPSRIGDDEIAFEGTAPETIITPEPQKLYVQYTPKEIFDLMSSMITPYESVELPKPLTATERLKEISDNRVSLLLKDLEDSIIRSYRLNDFDKEKLRRDVEDLLFYRNMAAYGGGIGDDDLVQKNSTISVAGLPYVSTEVEISPEASLRRANRVYSNYDQAVDAPLSWGLKTARNTLRWLKDNVNENIPSGVSNCTLSATLWVDPTNPIKNASSIVNDPNRYNYEPIEAGQAQVGDVLITRNPNDGSYHTMLISGYSNDGGVYDFDGTLMKYGKNEPLLTYSRGGHDASFIRRDIPLSIYLLNSDGKTEQHFFRYNKPSRVLKAILKARKKAYGGNLFDGTTQPTQQIQKKLPSVFTDNVGITYYHPYYDSYHRLTRNATTPEVVIKPDNLLSPAERNKRERERQRNHDAYYGLGTYSAMRDQENTQANILKTEKEWENSTEHKLLKAAEAVAQGVGIGSDIVSTSMGGIPVYSALKGAQALDRATHSGNGWDYAESAMWLSPLAGVAGKELYGAGKNALSEIYNLYKNYPIRKYNIESILKSDFYKNLSEKFGKEFADDFAQRMTSLDFRNYFFGDNPRLAIKAGEQHAKQMLIIKEVEDAGGMLSGSGLLARNGTVHREGLLHDLDFNVPRGETSISSPVFDALEYPSYATNTANTFGTGARPLPRRVIKGEDYVNVPQSKDDIGIDMFIRDSEKMPTQEEITDVILDAKRRWGRPKDLADIEAFTPYSSENPVINLATGEGQWNPTLFDNGIFTSEGYPYVQAVETYPGSGIEVPAIMNYRGQIRSVMNNTKIPQITAENAVSEMPNIIRTVLDNGKIRLSLPSHTDAKPRLLVIEPLGDNKYYVHTRTWDGDHVPANMSASEKQALYDALYEELPEGAEILLPESGEGYYATRGTVAGLQKLARDSRFTPGTRGTLLYLDKDGKTVRTYEGTSFIKAPRTTSENAADMAPEQLAILGSALESPYKDDNGFNFLVKHLYNKKIHGYPSYTKEAMQFDPVAGDFTPVKREWADDVVLGLPKYAQDAVMHDVVDRNIAEFMREGLSLEEATKYAEAAKKQLSSVRSGTYSQRDYDKAGWGDFGGFYDPERNFISVNEAGNPKRVYTHEGRHLLDHKIDDEILFPSESTTFGTDFDSDVSNAIMQRTRLKQEMILRDAYDSDFESIPSSKYAEGLEDYNSMNREAITTNLDSRTYAYENFADINSLNSGTRIEELPTEAQNSFIDGLTDELVFEAIEHANGYGRRYINRLRDEGKLTSKKAQQFREAMKHVGVAAFPVAAGAGLLFGLNNL